MESLTTPDLYGKLAGFRHFRCVNGNLTALIAQDVPPEAAMAYISKLISFGEFNKHFTYSIWKKGANQASCGPAIFQFPDDEAPHPNHGCGFNGFHSLQQLYGSTYILSGLFSRKNRKNRIISGAIAGWGNIEVHYDGFRSQYAEVICLSYTPFNKKKVLQVAKEYDILAVPFYKLTKTVQKMGLYPTPKSLRPEKIKAAPTRLGFVIYKYFGPFYVIMGAWFIFLDITQGDIIGAILIAFVATFWGIKAWRVWSKILRAKLQKRPSTNSDHS